MRIICQLLLLMGLVQAFGSVKDVPIVEVKRAFKVAPLGENVRINCPIKGQPAPMITWSKGSEAITDYLWERISLDRKSLIITDVQYDDTGIYFCKGTNGYGSSEVRIDLLVLDKERYSNWKPDGGVQPIFTEDTSSSESTYFPNAGTDLRLECSALGQPEPYVYWLKNMARIGPDDKVLRLKKVEHEDSAIYTCVAQNKFGIAARNFSVQVVSNEIIANEKFTDPSKPVLMPDYSTIQHLILPNDPENITVESDGKAILEFKAKGKCTWLKKLHPGEVVPDSKAVINLKPDPFLVIEDSERIQSYSEASSLGDFFINRLKISPVSKRDEGMYYCVVNDPQDSRSTFKYSFLRVNQGLEDSLKSDPLIIVVACLGAFVLVFLILIIACILKKNRKPEQLQHTLPASHNTSVESPEVQERMLDPYQSRVTRQDFYAYNPKMGLPLPPTPYEESKVRQPSNHTFRSSHSRR